MLGEEKRKSRKNGVEENFKYLEFTYLLNDGRRSARKQVRLLKDSKFRYLESMEQKAISVRTIQ